MYRVPAWAHDRISQMLQDILRPESAYDKSWPKGLRDEAAQMESDQIAIAIQESLDEEALLRCEGEESLLGRF